MSKKDDPILSPFYHGSKNDAEAFFEEAKRLCEKYGWQQWAIVIAEPTDNLSSNFTCDTSSKVSEGLVEYIQEVHDWLEEKFDGRRDN